MNYYMNMLIYFSECWQILLIIPFLLIKKIIFMHLNNFDLI